MNLVYFRRISGNLILVLCLSLFQTLLLPLGSQPFLFAESQSQSKENESFFRSGKTIFPSSFQNETERPSSNQGSSSNQVSRDYPVGPGDKFILNFWGRIEDNIVISINNEHQLFIPRIGVLDTKGMLYGDLLKELENKVKAKMQNVQFTIAIYEQREFEVYVLGAVLTPGPLPASASKRASDLIAEAGGPSPFGSQQFIELRREGEVIPVDLLSYQSFADFSGNPFVSDGDIIFVPMLTDFVSVSGAVVSPGTFEIRNERTIAKVIERMGGLSVYADRKAPIKLSRLDPSGGRKKLELNLQTQGEFELQNGDELFVPAAQILIPSQSTAVFVTGAVRAPGAKPFGLSITVDEYIGAAGGLTERANFNAAVIYKPDGSIQDLSPRTVLEPGDTVHIPERTFKFWQDHLAIVTTFISLATSIIVLANR